MPCPAELLGVPQTHHKPSWATAAPPWGRAAGQAGCPPAAPAPPRLGKGWSQEPVPVPGPAGSHWGGRWQGPRGQHSAAGRRQRSGTLGTRTLGTRPSLLVGTPLVSWYPGTGSQTSTGEWERDGDGQPLPQGSIAREGLCSWRVPTSAPLLFRAPSHMPPPLPRAWPAPHCTVTPPKPTSPPAPATRGGQCLTGGSSPPRGGECLPGRQGTQA